MQVEVLATHAPVARRVVPLDVPRPHPGVTLLKGLDTVVMSTQHRN